jgi:hypothetical protein
VSGKQPLRAVHAAFAAALEPLGIEVGQDVLALWADRQEHGYDVLPVPALRALARTVEQLLDEVERPGESGV